MADGKRLQAVHPLAVDPQTLAARSDDVEVGTAREQLFDDRCEFVQNVFAIVGDQQHVPLSDGRRGPLDERHRAFVADAERGGDGRQDRCVRK